jgi:hypothetical protein
VPVADGYWHAADVPIPLPGHGYVRVEAVTAFEKIALEDDFEVPAP